MPDEQENNNPSNWWARLAITALILVGVLWAVVQMSWYLAGSSAGTIEEAAFATLKKYGETPTERLKVRETPSRNADPTIRSVVLETEAGEVRYRIDLKPVGERRWVEMSYQKIDPKSVLVTEP